MSDAATIPDDDLAQVHRAALARLREMAMDMAERVHAASTEPEADVGAMAVKFARVARTVRLTIALESHLAELGRKRAAAEAATTQPDDDDDDHPWWLKFHRNQARAAEAKAQRKLEGFSLIQRAMAKEPLERERFEVRLFNLLSHDHFDATFALARFGGHTDPVAEVIARLCHRIGLTPDWSAFTELDWKMAQPETRQALIDGDFDLPERRYPPEQYDPKPQEFADILGP